MSPGHLADFDSSRRLVLRCASKYRLPEPTRRAHLAVGKTKRDHVERLE
ncbi:MAG: endonuclease V [Actinomycetota bacterium]